MSNFLATSHQKEKSPGMLWAWKSFWNGSICYEEGVWFHTRLLASAVSQLLVVFVSISLMALAIWEVSSAYADYRGEVGVSLINLSNEAFVIEDGEHKIKGNCSYNIAVFD